MPAPVALLLALAALLLGPPWGLLLTLPAARLGAGASGVLGVVLLALWGRPAAQTARPSSEARAGRLVATWESLGGSRAWLLTSAGVVEVQLAGEVSVPPAGTRVEAALRGRPGRRPTVVALRALAPEPVALAPQLRAWMRAELRRRLRAPGRGLVRALTLGEREDLHRASQRHARRTGTAHLLALSGLHVALLAGMLLATGRGLLGRRWPWVSVLLFAFAALVGRRAPLWRATVGRLAARLGQRRGAGADALQRLLLTAVLLGVVRPEWFSELGTQLSFLAVAGLLACSRALPPGPAQLLAPCGAFLVTAPLAVETFGEIQPWGLLVTPLLVPPLAALLGLGLALPFASALWSPLADALAWLLDGLAGLFLQSLERLAALLPPMLAPAPLPLPGWCAGLLVLAALLRLGRARASRQTLSERWT